MVTLPTTCDFCKKSGSLVIERNTITSRLLVGCLHCGYWWSAPASAHVERRSAADRLAARRTNLRERR
jgi:DNA-directed RNA polymerase subunit M/transcription elongation factor TFIIS